MPELPFHLSFIKVISNLLLSSATSKGYADCGKHEDVSSSSVTEKRFSHARFARGTEPPEKPIMNHFFFSLCSMRLCVRRILFLEAPKKLEVFFSTKNNVHVGVKCI